MDRYQRGWFRLCARMNFLEYKRQEFQAWVGKILERGMRGDYTPIRLTQGDGGLDGIILSESGAVAIYAPRETTQSELEAKLTSDFASATVTLQKQNATLRKFVFVHNDEGLTKQIGPFLLALRQANSNVTFEVWTFERLWTFMETTFSDQCFEDVLGSAPTSQSLERLEMPEIRDVIDFLTSVQAAPEPLVKITIPDPGKLEYNQLNVYNQHLLCGGRLKQHKVEQYLAGLTDPIKGEKIAEGFRKKYATCRESGMLPDETFETLWQFAGGHHFTRPGQQAGVTAVMSHFFDSCDIFENVPETT